MRRALGLLLAFGCTSESSIRLELRAADDLDPVTAGANRILLEVEGAPARVVPLYAGSYPDALDFELPEDRTTRVSLLVEDQVGKIIARAESPPLAARARGTVVMLIGRPAAFGTPGGPGLAPARTRHAATLVAPELGALLTGGRGTAGPLDTVQLYRLDRHDLVAARQPLPSPRAEHAGAVVVEPASGLPLAVLLGGRELAGAPTSRCDLFSPLSTAPPYYVTLAEAGDAQRARAGGAVAVLGTRLVLAGGLGGGDAPTAGALELDVASATAAPTLLSWPGAQPRAGATATVTSDGKQVIVVGGGPAGMPTLERILETATGLGGDVPAAAPAQNRHDHAAVLLPDGRVLFIGGRDDAGAALASATVYDPATMTSTDLPGFLAAARASHAAIRIRGDVVIAGGLGADGALFATAEVIDAATLARIGTPAAPAGARPTFTDLGNGQALLAGGEDAAGAPLATLAIYTARR
jgi:hypothetical protein